MDFVDQLKQFQARVNSIKEDILTEEATKTSIVMPFFAMLGYDVFNPSEFVPEYIADVGIKKGEKVDYAIKFDGVPAILVEVKSIKEKLTKHSSQLFRYFGTSKAKFAILTNGLIYQFFTDLEDTNKMDEKPFLEIDITDIKDFQIIELKKFVKTHFDPSEIFSVASDLKYSYEFKNIFAEELNNPSDEFVKLFLNKTYDGMKTQNVIDKFKTVLKKSLNTYIAELMGEKLKSALGTEENIEIPVTNDVVETTQESKIVTTEEELEGYFIVKNMLEGLTDITNITYKDTEAYMGVLFAGKVTNWICRLYFNSDIKKYFTIPDENKKPVKIYIDNVYELKNYKKEIIEVAKRYIK